MIRLYMYKYLIKIDECGATFSVLKFNQKVAYDALE